MASFQDSINQNIIDPINDITNDIVDPINTAVDTISDFNNFVNDITSDPLGTLGITDAINSVTGALDRLSASLFGGTGLRFPDNLMQESGGNYMIFESQGSNVALFLPRNVSFQYGMNWQEMDTFSALRILLDEGPRIAEIYKRSSDMKILLLLLEILALLMLRLVLVQILLIMLLVLNYPMMLLMLENLVD